MLQLIAILYLLKYAFCNFEEIYASEFFIS